MLQFIIDLVALCFTAIPSVSIGHLHSVAQPQIVRILLFLEAIHLSHNIESSMNIALTDNVVKFTINPSQLSIYIPSLMLYLVHLDLDNVIYGW